MFGILWSKPGMMPVLSQCGKDYATLDCYLEDAYMHSKWFLEGFTPRIVSVHQENGEWIY